MLNPLPLPLIKICGLTRVADIEAVANAGANAVGINLVPGSPRCVSAKQAKELIVSCREFGLFVLAVVRNLSASQLSEQVAKLDLDGVQLHGDEQPQILPACGDGVVIKAVSWSGREHEEETASIWKDCFHRKQPVDANSAAKPYAFLVDAYAPLTGGGTGKTARWDLIWPRPESLKGTPLILAGGLRPDNVAEAIERTRCDGVDTASGVELTPGVKSSRLIHEFVAKSKSAFEKRTEE